MRLRRRILGVSYFFPFPFPLCHFPVLFLSTEPQLPRSSMELPTNANQPPAKQKTKNATSAVAAGKNAMNDTVANVITARTAMRGRTMTMSVDDIGGRGRGNMRVIPRAILVRMRGLGGGIRRGVILLM